MTLRGHDSKSRGRGTYASQACNLCRLRKTKCSGPVCDSCLDSGHEGTWGEENTKKLLGSVKHQNQVLKNRIRILEASVQRCRQEHGGLGDDPASDLDLQQEQIGDDNEMLGFSDDDDENQFVLGDRDLQHYGPTSIFQYAPKIPERRSRFPEIVETTSRCYVLLIDGEDQSHYNPDFEWSRHLPPEVPLDRREHDKLLDIFFKFSASWCLRVVPPLFLRDMWRALSVPHSQIPPNTPHYSPMLHNALVALATAFSDDPRLRNIQSRQYFAQLAKSYIDKECQTPNISVVQALSILGSFHVAQGDHALGYMYFGMSGRISQALGLGVDSSACVKANLISHDDMLDRNWAYWTTFCHDVLFSLYLGRGFSVPEADKNTIPVPFVDSDFDELVFNYRPSGLPPQPTYQSKIFAETCELLKIGRRIMVFANSLGSRHSEIKSISRIDIQLKTWKERLSPEAQITQTTATPHRLMLHLFYWQLFILLHRPFYGRSFKFNSEQEIDHVKVCNQAADIIMDLLGTWRSLYTLRYGPLIIGQLLSSAGSIFFHSALLAASGARVGEVSLRSSLSQMRLCLQYLQEVGRSYQCARTVAGILHSLLQKRLNPLLATRSQEPGQALPQINSTANSQISSTSSQIPLAPQPSYANDAVAGPSYHGTQQSGVYNPPHQGHPHMQAGNSQLGVGWAPTYPGPVRSGPLPMGTQLMGNESWSNRRFIPLDLAGSAQSSEDYYQSHLGLPQEYEISTQGPPLADEDHETLEQFMRHSFG